MTVRELRQALFDLTDQEAEVLVRSALGTDDPIETVGLDPDGETVIILDLRVAP